MAQSLFFIGIFLIAMVIKFGAGWVVLTIGFISLLLACATPAIRALFSH